MKIQSNRTGFQQLRDAVTLMEVIFAIGIVLTGLVGLTALIPVAATNARATLEIDRSISESTSAAAAGLVHSFNDLNSLVIFDKPASGSPAFIAGSYDYVPSNSMRTIAWKMIQTNQDPPFVPPFQPFELIGKLETPGYGHMPLGSGLQSAICIDPLGMPDPNLANPFTAVATADSAFDYSRFPYYGERYRVLEEPNNQIGTVSVPAGTTPLWPMSPRMWRATLKSPILTAGAAVQRRQLMPSAAARSIFRGSGGLSVIDGAEKDNPRSVLISDTILGGNVVDSATDNSSDYTWFMTLVPPFLGGNSFRQSIVVVRKRLPPIPNRPGDPTALRKASHTIDDADDNPAAERLTWINPLEVIGFNGGIGGELRIYGSEKVSDKIESGQWVMLSRQPHLNTAGVLTTTGPAVHRWYKVLRVNETEYLSGYAWPGTTAPNVWRRWVTLSGSDWGFQDETGGNTTPIDDTFCTIVTGAVSVIESEVVIQ